jgi:MerR family copper efflux transcriptional regulator
MRIGELARHAEVNIQTLRFYEREGLLPAPLRSGSGYRIYEISDLERVRFIRNCQGLGFTLREIQQLIHLHSGLSRSRRAVAMKPVPVLEIIELANERMLVIDEKIRALNSMRDELITLVNTLANTSPAVCLASRQKNQRQEK